MQAGKHVFCEKPMAQTTEGVEQCFRAAEEAGKKFKIFFCFTISSVSQFLLFYNFFCFILLQSLSFEGKTLFCAFNRRFGPSFRDAYNKVRKGNQENLILVFLKGKLGEIFLLVQSFYLTLTKRSFNRQF